MNDGDSLNIADLADAAGISRRAVRFYVQRGLLPPPTGLGRGNHYDQSHVQRLREIQELQRAGHSLDAIKRIFEGEPVDILPAPAPMKARPVLSAELWTRLQLADGVELSFDTNKRNLTVEEILAIQNAVRAILEQRPAAEEDARDPEVL